MKSVSTEEQTGFDDRILSIATTDFIPIYLSFVAYRIRAFVCIPCKRDVSRKIQTRTGHQRRVRREKIARVSTVRNGMAGSDTHSGAVPLRFCPNSNDLLYPKEDRVNKKLVYFCRNCDYTIAATENCVHRRTIFHSASEITAVIHDVRTDPTLPRSKDVQCSLCDAREAVFFSQTTTEGMSLFFQCINCGNKWKDTGTVA